jgi:hypothetical protein
MSQEGLIEGIDAREQDVSKEPDGDRYCFNRVSVHTCTEKDSKPDRLGSVEGTCVSTPAVVMFDGGAKSLCFISRVRMAACV